MDFPILIPSVSDLPSGGACVSPGDTPGEFADLIDSLLNSLGHPNGESAQGDNEEPALQPAPRSTGLSGAPSPVPVDAPSLSRVDGSESENVGKGAQLGAGYQSAPRDRPAASAPPGGTETRQVPVPLVLDLPIVPTREHVPTGPVPETADADGSLTMPAELRLPEALCRSTADGRHDSASEWTDAFGPPTDGSLTTGTGEIAPAIVTRRTEETSVNKEGDVPPVAMTIPIADGTGSPDSDGSTVDGTATLALVEQIQEWVEQVDRSDEPNSIALEFPDPEGDLLVKLAMREGRIELDVIRPGGEAPAWLRDRLDEELTRHGFDMSHSGDREDTTRDGDEPMPRSSARPSRTRHERRDGIWM